MITIPEECYVPKKHIGKQLVCEENGRRVVFVKPKDKAVEKIKVDGCVLKNTLACDYLVRDWKKRHHFVELKGSNVEHALQQIAATIPHFIEPNAKEEFWCLVACSGAPPASSPGLQTAKLRIVKRWKNARFDITTNRCEHKLT